jgi:hypothetical protein
MKKLDFSLQKNGIIFYRWTRKTITNPKPAPAKTTVANGKSARNSLISNYAGRNAGFGLHAITWAARKKTKRPGRKSCQTMKFSSAASAKRPTPYGK